MIISPKEIGRRIISIRKLKGLSQEELAKNIGMNRTTLAKIELGNRHIDIFEFYKLSKVLEFSLDDILSENFKINEKIKSHKEKEKRKKQIRISTPKLQVNKFKNVILYITELCAGMPTFTETVLHKLLYFSDFNYYELYEEHLTGATYYKLSNGPTPKKINTIIHQMLEKEQLKRIKTEYHHTVQVKYLPLKKADLTQLKASEKDVIDKVIEQMGEWTPEIIINYSLNDMPCLASKEGEKINYELVFYRDIPYSVRNYEGEF